jgi:hypothetical protein
MNNLALLLGVGTALIGLIVQPSGPSARRMWLMLLALTTKQRGIYR